MDGNPNFARFVLVFQHNILLPVTVTKLLIDDKYFNMLHTMRSLMVPFNIDHLSKLSYLQIVLTLVTQRFDTLSDSCQYCLILCVFNLES